MHVNAQLLNCCLITSGSDYTEFEPFQISFSSSSSSSRSFEVTTIDDSLIEPNEFFDIVVSRYRVMDSDNNTQDLSNQENRRILVENDRTTVFIIDSDGKMKSYPLDF